MYSDRGRIQGRWHCPIGYPSGHATHPGHPLRWCPGPQV